MRGIIGVMTQIIRAGQLAYAKKWSFLGLFVVVFLGTTIALGKLDLLPEVSSAATTVNKSGTINTEVQQQMITELPTRIEIAKIKLGAAISNPTTTDVIILDKELLKGAVRYPTSAKLGETGNVVLFAHSSYIPVVGNQTYKTFNGIQKLVAGDIVTVYSSLEAYTYSVRSVTKESANENSAIPLSISEKMLTLVTCDSFGAKTDRFVVVANFVESHSISI